MSAIGEYIHLTKTGYNKHGISRNGSNNIWKSQLEWRQKQVQNLTVDEKKLRDYEELVKEIVNPNKQNTNISQVAQDIIDYTVKQFDNKFQQVNVDLNNVQINMSDSREDYIGRVKTRMSKTVDGKIIHTITTTMETLLNKINTLESMITQIPENLTDKSAKDLAARVDKIKELYGEAFNLTKKQIAKWKDNQEKFKKISPSGGAKVVALRAELNRAIELYASYPAINLYEGTLFENILGSALWATDMAAYRTIEDVIKTTVKGDENITVNFNQNAFDKSFQDKIILPDGSKLQLSGQVNYRSKIDVAFEWKNQPFRISAKNLTIHGHQGTASLVDGSPLTTMVQNMDTDFVNHYLNLASIQGLKTSDKAKEAKAEMKKNLAITALAGLHINNKNAHANIFAVNDKEGQGVKFITVKNLSEKMETMQKSVSVKYNNKNRVTEFSFNRNIKQETAQARIIKLIQEMHSLKVHTAINIANLLYSS